MTEEREKLNLIGDNIKCHEERCADLALTTCKCCWKHLSDDEKAGFKDKIKSLAKERKFDLQLFVLREANLSETVLELTDFQGAYLKKVDFQKAILWKADLQGADLEGANLRKADLLEVNLQGADLTNANLSGANLRGANLCRANLFNIKYDDKTSFSGIIDVCLPEDHLQKRHLED